MVKCSACGKFLSLTGAAVCVTCPFMSHKSCVSIAETEIISKTWNCPDCKRRAIKNDSNTPAQLQTDSTTDVSLPTAGLSQYCDDDNEVRAMRREFAEYMGEIREFRKEMVDFRASVASLGKRLDGIENRLETLEKKEANTSESKNFQELENTISQLKLELNERDQEVLLSDLDIGGLPETKGENVIHSVTTLAVKLGIKIDAGDIVFAERVGRHNATESNVEDTRERARRVVVRLTRRHLRDELLRAARVRRNFTSADMGLPGTPCRIYINERLTRSYRQLFHLVREECRKSNWKYSWTKKGRIFARQADGKQAFPIRSTADIVRVFKGKNV